jgi:transcriptional regulator with PAS, ATPase and Fis domain
MYTDWRTRQMTKFDASAPTAPEAPVVPATGLQLLVMLEDGSQAHELPDGRSVVVGRAPECDIRVDLASMSRRHFAIHVREPMLSLEDLGGANGTKLNGNRLEPRSPTTLEVGNLIEAGGVFFMLRHPTIRVGNLSLPRSSAAPRSPDVVIEDVSMERIHTLVEMVARSNIPVLVMGETGVGKEIISEAIHKRSPRSAKPYVKLNCAALPEALLESELFGYERGAFTGASQAKQGLIEAAHEGTLFLDEIGEMPMATQAKLLRVLENGELLRLGSVKPKVVDVRFIAATNRKLPHLLAKGQFRRDLYFRLNGITIPVPPLRERTSEIPALAAFFLERAARRSGRRAPSLGKPVLDLMVEHTWPGNIRELKNTVERALTLCDGAELAIHHVLLDHDVAHLIHDPQLPDERPSPTPPAPAPSPPPPGMTLPDRQGRLLRMDPGTERDLIAKALEEAAGNQSRASRILGISRRTLVNRLAEYGMRRPRKGTDEED